METAVSERRKDSEGADDGRFCFGGIEVRLCGATVVSSGGDAFAAGVAAEDFDGGADCAGGCFGAVDFDVAEGDLEAGGDGLDFCIESWVFWGCRRVGFTVSFASGSESRSSRSRLLSVLAGTGCFAAGGGADWGGVIGCGPGWAVVADFGAGVDAGGGVDLTGALAAGLAAGF